MTLAVPPGAAHCGYCISAHTAGIGPVRPRHPDRTQDRRRPCPSFPSRVRESPPPTRRATTDRHLTLDSAKCLP